MAKSVLTLILAGRTIERWEFEDVDQIAIGRAEDNDVQIDNIGISRLHCEISRTGDAYQLHDSGSDNGTHVNGKRLSHVFNLNSGDRIELGKYVLRFECDQLQTGRAAQPKPKQGARTAVAPMKRHHQQPKAVGYLQPENGAPILIDKSPLLFGKRSDCHVQLSGWSCPAVAAILIVDQAGFHLLDLSPNGDGVTVNEVVAKTAWLNDDDRVQIRGLDVRFRRGRP